MSWTTKDIKVDLEVEFSCKQLAEMLGDMKDNQVVDIVTEWAHLNADGAKLLVKTLREEDLIGD